MKMKTNIAIAGKMHDGKSSVAAILADEYGYARWSFAGPVKELGDKALVQVIDPYLRDISGKEIKATKAMNRAMYQFAGARGRAYDKDLWVRQLSRRFTRAGMPRGIVIDDMRYLNEAAWAKANEFLVIRVQRPESGRLDSARAAFVADYGREPQEWEWLAILNHESETEVDSITWDHLIENSKDLDHLKTRIANILSVT